MKFWPAHGTSPSLAGDPDMAPQDRGRLAAQAQRLLDDPVLALAFERVSAGFVASWRGSKLGDAAAREAAYRLHFALEAVKAELARFIGDGKVLAAELARKEREEKAATERRAQRP